MKLHLAILVSFALASPKMPWTIEFTHPNGQVGRGRLLSNHTFDSIPCEANKDFALDENGKLKSCTVSRNFDYQGVEIEAHAFTLMHEPQRLYSTRIRRPRPFPLKSGTVVPCDNDEIILNNAGYLESCKLATTTTFDGVSCRAKELANFSPSGHLSACHIDTPFLSPIAGSFGPGTSLGFHDDGTLRVAYLETPRVVGGLTIRGSFSLHPNGKLAYAQLAAPWTFGTQTFREDSYLSFREDGTLLEASFVQAKGAEPNGFRWSDTMHLYFDGTGKLSSSKIEHYQTRATPPHH